MADTALIFALIFAGVILLSRRRLIYGLLSLVSGLYLLIPSEMEHLANRWFKIAVSKTASDILFFLIIAVIVIAILGPRAKRGLAKHPS